MSKSDSLQPDRKPTTPAAKSASALGGGKPPAVPPSARETQRPTDSTPMQSGSFARLPMRFGRYQIEKLLGRGNMGAVYLAMDTQLGRKVAIKIPKVSASGSQKLLKRLETEAKAAAQVEHPSVCPVYDWGQIDGTAFIAMQYVEGETLKDHLKAQQKTPQEAVALILQLAEGLAEAHAKKICHRDLKPDNIKLNKRGVPVIMDFGLAKLTSRQSSDASATQAGTTLGTPAYMSPEQANGQIDRIDHRSDVYALGVIFYEMLTGQWPFMGSAMQVMGQKTMQEAPSPLSVKPDLNPDLAAVCQKMLAKERDQRTENAEGMIAELKKIDLSRAGPDVSDQRPVLLGFAGMERDEALASMISRIRRNRTVKTTRRERLHAFVSRAMGKVRSARPVLWRRIGVVILVVGAVVAGVSGVITVQTQEGLLTIEVNEPDAEVLVDGENVDITWEQGHQTAHVRVRPGKREISVTKEGFSVDGTTLSFRAGETTVFAAKLDPKSNSSETPGTGSKRSARGAVREDGTGPGDERDDNGLSMKLLWCQPGQCTLGSPQTERGRAPGEDQVRLTLTRGFWLGKFEVTQQQWQKVMRTTPWRGKQDAREGPDYPATYVSWDDAVQFAVALTRQEREAGRLPEGWEYELPTEAQWEYACRAGSQTRFSFGDDDSRLSDYGWWGGWSDGNAKNERYAHRVGSKSPNAWGLCDMHGNVCEWCRDTDSPRQPGGVDPKEATGGRSRVNRGSGWAYDAARSRSARRSWASPDFLDGILGLRIALVRTAADVGRLAKAQQLPAGSVWKGTRSYRKGGYAGATVAYELHVTSRTGEKFIGHKFDNGANRNYVDVEGELNGTSISWRERNASDPNTVLTMQGTIENDTIRLTFTGRYSNGATNEGDGELRRTVN